MKVRGAWLSLALAVVCPSLAVAHVDGMSLSVSLGTGPGQVNLDWTGGQPAFHVYRSTVASGIISPGNKLGDTPVRNWSDTPGPGSLFFYMLTSDCVYGPPEICDGVDNDCNGTIDGPGSEASCNLANATPQCAGGTCVVAACNPGFGDCDTQPADGCESNLSSDANHCGTCAISCVDATSCTVDSCANASCHHLDQRACVAAPTSGEGGVSCATSPGTSGCWGGCSAAQGVVPLPPGCANPDSDGDGLGDTWESGHWIDYDCDGIQNTGPTGVDLALPDDPDWDEVTQKNAYVVYDWMSPDPSDPLDVSHQPYPDFIGKDYDGTTDAPVDGTLKRVKDAYARKGIRLKIDPNTNPSAVTSTNPTGITSPLPHVSVVSFANPVGDCATNGGVNSAVSFYALKGANFDQRKKFTHKYAVFGHNAECSGNCSSSACLAENSVLGICGTVGERTTGMAELAGDDIIVSLGGHNLSDGSSAVEPDRTKLRDQLVSYQAGTIMHEIGHTFGLDHGGASTGGSPSCDTSSDSAIPRKPNHISSMNYVFQLNGITTAATNCSTVPLPPDPRYAQFPPGGAWRVDYSGPPPSPLPLDENSLFESDGISSCVCGGTSGLRDISKAYAFCFAPPVPIPGCGPVDWNRSGFIDPIPVAVDINQDALDDPTATCPAYRPLNGFDDWSFVGLHLSFQCGANFEDGVSFHRFPSTPELHQQGTGAP
ncbi:MAG TPA: hypothetical protein VFW45_17280 [Candidatus Polarisedimenticolia bacterium]|nr:hypothetical protein [Candidatus Polarisedimenticolia bacterium]